MSRNVTVPVMGFLAYKKHEKLVRL